MPTAPASPISNPLSIGASSTEATEKALCCRNVGFVWDYNGPREKGVLKDISLTIRPTEVVAIVGPTGCGKSTLLRILMGLMSPTTGEVFIDGEVVRSPSKKVGVMFQEHGLFPWLTVRENVEFGLKMRGDQPLERQTRGQSVLQAVGLAAERERYPHELSGGMKRRVAIARLLASDARYLLMDEPFEALDYETRLRMQHFLLSIHRQFANAILLVTHQVDEAILLSDRIMLMGARSGRFVHELRIDLARPRDSATEPFNAYRTQILTHLKSEVVASLGSDQL